MPARGSWLTTSPSGTVSENSSAVVTSSCAFSSASAASAADCPTTAGTATGWTPRLTTKSTGSPRRSRCPASGREEITVPLGTVSL